MAGISDLVSQISGSVSNLLSKSSGNIVNYNQDDPDLQIIQSTINEASWMKLIYPYTFCVIDLDNPTAADSGFSDFALPLAPQSINQKEEPATNIRPTQGGTTVNHGGLGYKTLNISGTTGIAPFRGAGGVTAATGTAIFQPAGLKYKSGYEVFLHLRNWFRSYYQWKQKQGADASSYRLVFKNFKDGEYLIVELLSFEMDRNATKSFMYDYKLEFKVLSHYQVTLPKTTLDFLGNVDALIASATAAISTARGILLASQGILRQIEATYESSVLDPLRQVTLALKALQGIPLVAADMASKAVANTVSTVKALDILAQSTSSLTGTSIDSATKAKLAALVDPSQVSGSGDKVQNAINQAQQKISQSGSAGLFSLGGLLTQVNVGSFPATTLALAAQEQQAAAGMPRSAFEDIITNLQRVKDNAEDFFNLGSTQYDAIFDRTSTLNADPTKTATQSELDVLEGFNQALIGMYLMLSTDAMFKSDYNDQIADMNARFNNQIALSTAQAVRSITLPAGVTLERLALQELGDPSRWGEIVELNGLKAPYVSDTPGDTTDGVIVAGQQILIPSKVVNGFSNVPLVKDNKLTVGMSQVEKSLGVDFKVDENFDLVLNASGDFELVAGADNMSQATILHMTYEPGDVIAHPSIGAGAAPGGKFPPLSQLQTLITNSLLQDSRVAKVTDLSLIRDGGALYISFNLYVKQVDIPIPIKIKV